MPQQTSIYQLPYPEPTDIPDVPEDMRRLAEATEIAIDSSIPIGAIMMWGGTAAPSGWHSCDGTPHGSPALELILGSATAPDLRDRFVVGVSANYPRGATGGANTVRLTAATSGIGTHVHSGSATVNVPAHQHWVQPIGTGTGHDDTDHAHWNPNIHRWSFTGGGHEHSIQLTDGSGSGDGVYVDTNPTRGTHKNIAGNTAGGGGHEHATDVGGYHSHGATARHAHGVTVPGHATDAAGASGAVALSISASNPADAGADHENRPPYYALMFIIKKA